MFMFCLLSVLPLPWYAEAGGFFVHFSQRDRFTSFYCDGILDGGILFLVVSYLPRWTNGIFSCAGRRR